MRVSERREGLSPALGWVELVAASAVSMRDKTYTNPEFPRKPTINTAIAVLEGSCVVTKIPPKSVETHPMRYK